MSCPVCWDKKSKRKTKKERDKKRQNQRKRQRQGQIKGQKYQKINSLVKSAQICRRWKSWGQSHFKVSLLRKLLVISFKVWSHIVPLMASTPFLSLGLINLECILEQTNITRACYEVQTLSKEPKIAFWVIHFRNDIWNG